MRDFLILFVHVIVTVARLAKARRTPFRRRRIRAGPASTAGPQSRPQACAQPPRHGSYHRRLVHPFHATGPRPPFRHRSEAFHSAPSPQCAEETKVPLVVFARAQASAWSEGTEERPDRRSRRDETAQSQLGLSPHCSADRVGFRCRDRQGCCSPYPERSLPAEIRFGRAFLAYVSWPDKGQFVLLDLGFFAARDDFMLPTS